MATTSIVAKALARHLSVVELLRDLAVLLALGLLASFAVLFVSRAPFDNVRYEAGLDYQARVEAAADHDDGLVIDLFDGFELSTRTSSGAHAPKRSVNATAQVYSEGRGVDAARLFAGTLVAGELCAEGVVIDEATAASFGLGVGDTVVVSWRDAPDPDTRETPVRVCGIGLPWHPGGDLGTRGYLRWARVTAEALTPGLADADPSSQATFWLDRQVRGGTTKWQSTTAILGRNLPASAFLLAVIGVGAALWIIGLQRATSGLRTSLATPTQILRALGAPPPGWLVVFLGLSWTMSLLASIGAAVIARAVIRGWTGLWIASTQIVVVALTLFVVALAATTALGWRRTRSW